jgi:hypothetical protein
MEPLEEVRLAVADTQTKALLTECKNGNLKMLTFKVGACATPASGTAMAEYYLSATLKADPAAAAAYYYAGAETEQHSAAASHGATRHITDGATVALLRRDISAALAARLGITEPARPLTQDQIANLLNARRLDGNAAIDARKKHSATRSVAQVFALDPRDPPTAEAIRNVLAGKRADGGLPQSTSGSALPSAIVEGARKRFKAALDIPAHREATTEGLAHLANGELATGRFIDMADYRRQIHATRPPVGFVDLTFSADKSLSVAWALAPTEPERAALLDVHQQAVADAMSYAETKLGFARKGQGGADGLEPGALGWISFQHYTARPAVDIKDATRKAGLTPTFAKCRCRRRIRSCTRMSPCSTACSPKAGASAPSISICWPAASKNSAPSIRPMLPLARGASASKPCLMRRQGLHGSPMFRNPCASYSANGSRKPSKRRANSPPAKASIGMPSPASKRSRS